MKSSPCPICHSPMVGEHDTIDGTLVESSAYCTTCRMFSDNWIEGMYTSVIVGAKEFFDYGTAANEAVTECQRLLETCWAEFDQMWQRVVHWRTGILHHDQNALTAAGVLADWLEDRDFLILTAGLREWIENMNAENEISIKEFSRHENHFRL